MADTISIIDETLSKLKNSQKLSDVRFVHGYTDTFFPNPLKKPVCSVHLYSAENQKPVEDISNRKTSCKIVFYTYVPVSYGGYECIKLLEAMSEVLIGISGDESRRECIISDLAYDSNLHCYRGRLYLTLIYEDTAEDILAASGMSNVKVRINSTSLGLVKSVNIKKVNTGFDVYVYGQTKPYDTVLGNDKYIITLKRISLYGESFNLSDNKNFVLTLETDSGYIRYYDCNVSEITQSTENNKYSVEQAVITACSCSI